jgi:hypothetical protein
VLEILFVLSVQISLFFLKSPSQHLRVVDQLLLFLLSEPLRGFIELELLPGEEVDCGRTVGFEGHRRV